MQNALAFAFQTVQLRLSKSEKHTFALPSLLKQHRTWIFITKLSLCKLNLKWSWNGTGKVEKLRKSGSNEIEGNQSTEKLFTLM